MGKIYKNKGIKILITSLLCTLGLTCVNVSAMEAEKNETNLKFVSRLKKDAIKDEDLLNSLIDLEQSIYACGEIADRIILYIKPKEEPKEEHKIENPENKEENKNT